MQQSSQPHRDQDTATTAARGPAFWSALVLTGAICVVSFILSFVALADLLVLTGQPRELSYLFPIIIDGTILQSTIAIVFLAGDDSRVRDRRYFWFVLAAGAGVSIAGNALHAFVSHAPGFDPWAAAAISTIAPISLLAASHGLTIIARRSESAGESIDPKVEPARAAAVATAQPAPAAEAAVGAPVASPVVPTPEAVAEVPADAAVRPAVENIEILEVIPEEMLPVAPSFAAEVTTERTEGAYEEPRAAEPTPASETVVITRNDRAQAPRVLPARQAPIAAPTYNRAKPDPAQASVDELREYALACNARNIDVEDIAVEVNRATSTVYRWISEAKKTRPLVPQARVHS